MLRWLEKKLGWLAIPRLTLVLVFGQGFFYLVGLAQPELIDQMLFVPSRVLAGDWWRPITVLIMPPGTHPIFILFALYLLYLMGTALEHQWGDFRYNLYILIGYVATVASTLLLAAFVPELAYVPVSNVYLMTSIFLAFAFLYPDFQLLLFFILPVKVKWLAAITWGLYGFVFLTGGWLTRLTIVAAVLNFLLFFGVEIVQMIRRGKRAIERQTRQVAHRDEPFHKCVVCGRTDKSDPKLEFRYCNKCTGAPCYCIDHIRTHEHK